MDISVIIPAYNEESYIAACLEAVLREVHRTRCSAEIIVVNNCSRDRTLEVCRSFPGVRVVDEPTKGLTRARQAGYRASTGALIANVDADTRPPEGWLETVVREFHADQTLVALSGPFIYYDLPARVRALVDIFYRVGWLLHIVNHRLFRRGAMLQGGNFVVRRKALERIGGYDTRFEFYGEDTDIARRIQKVGRVRFTWDLPMSASGRRLRKEGVLTMGRRYAVNHVWTLVFKKPYTRRVKEL